MNRTTISTCAWSAVAALGLLAGCASQTQATSEPSRPVAGDTRALLDFNSCAKPMYPHEELSAGHEGIVKLGFLVKADGTVGEARVVGSSGFPALDEEARSALARCQFKPALRAGRPVEAWTDVQYVWATK